jgi:hypothetical protein
LESEEQRKPNPWIEGEDYFAEYNNSIKSNFNSDHFKYIELSKRLFNSVDGAEWLRMTKEHLNDTFVDINLPTAAQALIQLQGSKKLLKEIESILVNNKDK